MSPLSNVARHRAIAVLLDDRGVAADQTILPGGVCGGHELVGAATLLDSLRVLAPGGRACIPGYLEDEWDFGPAGAEAHRYMEANLPSANSWSLRRSACGGPSPAGRVEVTT